MAQNPSLHLPNALFARITRLPPTHENFEHSEEPNGCVERIITIREALLYDVRQVRIEFNVRLSCPVEQGTTCILSDLPIPFTSNAAVKEPAVTLCWIGLHDEDVSRLQQCIKGAVPFRLTPPAAGRRRHRSSLAASRRQ